MSFILFSAAVQCCKRLYIYLFCGCVIVIESIRRREGWQYGDAAFSKLLRIFVVFNLLFRYNLNFRNDELAFIASRGTR